MASNEDLVSNQVQKYFSGLLEDIGVKHSSVTISKGVEKGKNVVCTIARVQIVDNKGKKYSFIIKSASRDEEFRDFIQSSTLFEIELYVYTRVLTEFEKFQKKKKILNPFQSFPKFFGATSEYMHEAIVLEDMVAAGYQQLNSEKCLDHKHVMLVTKEFGKLHALSYALRDQEPQIFMELSKNTGEIFFSGKLWNNLNPIYTTTLIRTLEGINPEKNKTTYKKCSRLMCSLGKTAKKILKAETAGKYAVIGHGDCWINNILFKYKNHKPTDVCFLDWPFSRLGSPALDLSYFLFVSTDKETREKYYHHFIKEYHYSLCSFYSELTGNSEVCLPYEVLQEHLRRFSAYGLFMSIQALYIILNKPKDVEKTNSNSGTSKGINTLAYESVDLTNFNERVKDILVDYDKLGYDVD